MNKNLARFQGGALAIRPTTSWTKPTMGGRIKGAFTGLKRRAKNLLARPGIQNAMNRVGSTAGNATGWVRKKTGFSGERTLVSFARRRFLGKKRKSLLRRLALPAAGIGALGVLGGAGYLAHRSTKAYNAATNKGYETLKNVRQQETQKAVDAAAVKARLQERARNYNSTSVLAEFRRRRLKSRRKRKPTFGGHAGKGAAYGAMAGGATGAALGGAGTYSAARKMGMSRGAALGAGIIGGTLGGVQGTLSGALTGGTLGAATYGAKRIRRGD
jgi:hypothetical protein